MIRTPTFRRMADAAGVEWEVWEVHPRLADRRARHERRSAARPDGPVRRGATPDMRHWTAQHGWLVFRNEAGERRRHAIRLGWEQLSREGLQELLRSAATTGPFPRVRRSV